MKLVLIYQHKSESIVEISFENLFKIFPIGVTSKNRLIGALITLEIIKEWSHFEILKDPNENTNILAITSKLFKAPNKKMYPA